MSQDALVGQAGPHVTHEVSNQVPPLADYDVAGDPALLAALERDGAGWASHNLHQPPPDRPPPPRVSQAWRRTCAGRTRPCSSQGRSHRPAALPGHPRRPGRLAIWRALLPRAQLAVCCRPGEQAGACAPR